MKRRVFLGTIAGAATATLAGCGGVDAEGDYDVGMQSNAFVPTTFEVRVGDTVVWKNTGSRNHTVTAYGNAIPDDAAYFASGGFDSEAGARDAWNEHLSGGGIITPGDTYEHTFEVAGDFHYFCIPHEPAGMQGTIVVTE